MLTSILVLLGSVLVFVSVLGLVRVEQVRGERLVLGRTRALLDRSMTWVTRSFVTIRVVLGRFILQLGFRYAVHVVLRSILLGIASLYDRLMAYFEYNRQRTKAIRKAKRAWGEGKHSHLTELQKHQTTSALSDAEKQARKQAALEGK